MSIDETKLRLRALSAFEETVDRKATDDECSLIMHKRIRYGSSVYILFNHHGKLSTALGIQGTHYKTAGQYTATGGGLEDPEDNGDARVNALRELGEEVLDDNGAPILTIDPETLILEHEAIDITPLLPNATNPEWDIVVARVHSAFAPPREAMNLIWHNMRLKHDPAYAALSFAHTNNEVGGQKIVAVDHVTQDILDNIRHGHERVGLQNIIRRPIFA